MIVDLERNDLGHVCRTGSVAVVDLCSLRSFPAVHHLVARVEGAVRDGVGPAELVRAIFPGGSITGAPKRRAMEILRTVEPAPRGAYTGSLFWFGDDGAMRSSILIRSVVVRGRETSVGAGGGVVADSDPEAEWREANAKARALTRVLGFDPEEAT
jgi:anthranilate/para-aminobenzoate synthase component I